MSQANGIPRIFHHNDVLPYQRRGKSSYFLQGQVSDCSRPELLLEVSRMFSKAEHFLIGQLW